MKQMLALWEWTTALLALACWFYFGFQFLGLFMDVSGYVKLLCLWGGIALLLPALAAVSGLIGWQRASEVLQVSAGFIVLGGLAIGALALAVMAARDVFTNVFGEPILVHQTDF